MFAGEHTSTAGATERVGNKTVGETNAIASNAIEVGSFDVAYIVATHHLSCVVIGHDIDNVVGFRCLVGLLAC